MPSLIWDDMRHKIPGERIVKACQDRRSSEYASLTDVTAAAVLSVPALESKASLPCLKKHQ
jgi:hypothetical protein